MEDENQNIHLRNLSTHRAANEEEALNLLFMGDTNRMIAEVHKPSRHTMFIVLIYYVFTSYI